MLLFFYRATSIKASLITPRFKYLSQKVISYNLRIEIELIEKKYIMRRIELYTYFYREPIVAWYLIKNINVLLLLLSCILTPPHRR